MSQERASQIQEITREVDTDIFDSVQEIHKIANCIIFTEENVAWAERRNNPLEADSIMDTRESLLIDQYNGINMLMAKELLVAAFNLASSEVDDQEDAWLTAKMLLDDGDPRLWVILERIYERTMQSNEKYIHKSLPPFRIYKRARKLADDIKFDLYYVDE
jgi:hypothetical protein